MFGVDILAESGEGAVLVGSVLAEAMSLYVGYGALERIVGPTVAGMLRGE